MNPGAAPPTPVGGLKNEAKYKYLQEQ